MERLQAMVAEYQDNMQDELAKTWTTISGI